MVEPPIIFLTSVAQNSQGQWKGGKIEKLSVKKNLSKYDM